MKKLPETLTTDKFTLTQIRRDENFALYRQSKPGQADAFEVIRIQKREAGKAPDHWRREDDEEEKEVEAGEYYPKAHRWGVDGWTYASLAEATKKYGILQDSWDVQNLPDAQ